MEVRDQSLRGEQHSTGKQTKYGLEVYTILPLGDVTPISASPLDL
jgi:hypothetical protein